MKIDSCIIVKNEESNIENLIRQFIEYSNEIHITDTGSTDRTIEIIENLQKEYKNIFLHYFEWCYDFAKARNYSLTCYECNADYQFWCDSDDELNDKLIETLKKLNNDTNINDEVFYINYKYYETNNKLHYRTSILKVSANLKWMDPIHEYVQVYKTTKTNYDYFDNGSLIIHHPSKSEDHVKRNLEIFLNMEKTNYKFTQRNLYYYARALYNNRLNSYAIHKFKECINLQTKSIYNINSVIKLFQMRANDAFEWFNKVLNIGDYRKDMIYMAGDYFFNKKQYEEARLYFMMALNCKDPKKNTGEMIFYDVNTPINIYLKLVEVEKILGNIESSKIYNNEILKIDPNNKKALENKQLLN